jgi:hypothetical protein
MDIQLAEYALPVAPDGVGGRHADDKRKENYKLELLTFIWTFIQPG